MIVIFRVKTNTKYGVINSFLRLGCIIGKAPKASDLHDLIQLHRPEDTGYPLDRLVPKANDLRDLIQLLKPKDTGYPLVRIGSESDGGYLLPDDLKDIEACFSPGVGGVADFEDMLFTKYGIKSFLADYSVDVPPIVNPHFDFAKKFIGTVNDEKYIRLEDWINHKIDKKSARDLILQMDIEGDEYSVLLDTPMSVLNRFRIMVIEFHDMDMVCERKTLSFIAYVFRKICSNFSIAHIHPTNYRRTVRCHGMEIPIVMEVTFLRSDRVKQGNKKLTFPHPLDRKNAPHYPDIVLPECWR